MSFCSDINEIRELIAEVESGESTEEDLVIFTLGALAYKCDSPKLHGNCYESRREWAKEVYDYITTKWN